jgi:hypothetical protein
VVLQADDFAVVYGDHHGPLWPGLAGMPSLQITGVDHEWPLVQDVGPVHVAKRPVLVAVVDELLERAVRIFRVWAFPPLAGRMQHADVEQAVDRERVVPGDVVGEFGLREATPMDGDADIGEPHGFGPFGRENFDIGPEIQLANKGVLGVVVAEHHEYGDAGIGQAADARHEEQPGAHVAEIAVEDVAGEDDEATALGDGELD